jgi:hypothetical protein
MLHFLNLKTWTEATYAWHGERGEVTEKVIITAVFAGLAIAAGAVIVSKVMLKAENLTLD